MEPAGLAIGVAGLAGVFSTCLDVVERIDSYRDFGVDSRAIISQFDADRILFQQWGKAVGLEGNRLESDHHKRLDDPVVLSIVQKILVSINEIAGVPGDVSSSQQQGLGSTKSKGQAYTSRHLPFEKFRGESSRRNKVEWTLRQKARFVALSQQFGGLVERLRALVPPESTSEVVPTMRRTRTGLNPSMDGSSRTRDRQNGPVASLDSQLILIEIEKQIERKWPQSPS